MKRSPLAALTASLAALFVFGTAGPALAHDSLKSSDPAKGSTVTSLDEVKLDFTSSVKLPTVLVRDAGGAAFQTGSPELDGTTVRQALKDTLPGGKYTVAYRVVSSDGHPIEGEIPFTVKAAAAAPSPAGSAVSDADAGSSQAPVKKEEAAAPSFPVWLIIAIGGLIGIGIGFLFSARNKKR
ncbi:MAG: copper resistance protein CopC [Nonomuraea sp.]|nr:copper resistance protein CopC [Nonomuraea sp.]